MSQNYSAASAYKTAAENVSSLRAVVMLYDGVDRKESQVGIGQRCRGIVIAGSQVDITP